MFIVDIKVSRINILETLFLKYSGDVLNRKIFKFVIKMIIKVCQSVQACCAMSCISSGNFC